MRLTNLVFGRVLIVQFSLLLLPIAQAVEPSIRAILVEAMKANRDLDGALRSAYDAVQLRLDGLKYDAFKAEIEAAGGRELYATEYPGHSRMLVATSAATTASGRVHDLEVTVHYNPKTREVVQISPVVVAVLKRPIEKREYLKLYPAGSVAARALNISKDRKKIAGHPLLAGVEISYEAIGWPSNPIRGHGFTVDIEFKSSPNKRGKSSTATISFAAFAVFDTPGLEAEASATSPTGTKLLSIPDPSWIKELGVKPAFIYMGGTSDK